MNGGIGLTEKILGVNLTASQRKLLNMTNEAVLYYKKNPKALAELKRARSELCVRLMKLRIIAIPEPIRDCVGRLDNAGLPSETHALITMISFMVDATIEEVEKPD